MNKNEETKLAELLRQLEAGFLPYDVFVEVARLTTLSIIEFVPLRMTQTGVEVLLLKRGESDSIWPGQVHVPGSVIRPTDLDSDEHLTFKRILEDELQNTEVSQPHYVGSNLHKSKRGAEQAQIFWVEVNASPNVGEFFPAEKLPENIIESQLSFINLAVTDFKKYKSNN